MNLAAACIGLLALVAFCWARAALDAATEALRLATEAARQVDEVNAALPEVARLVLQATEKLDGHDESAERYLENIFARLRRIEEARDVNYIPSEN